MSNQQTPQSLSTGKTATTTYTFHPFPRLPLELRRAIWSLCVPGPRMLEEYAVDEMVAKHNQPSSLQLRKAAQLVPTLLLVNRESRLFAQEKYILLHGSRSSYAAFDPSKDILHLQSRRLSYRNNVLRFTTGYLEGHSSKSSFPANGAIEIRRVATNEMVRILSEEIIDDLSEIYYLVPKDHRCENPDGNEN